MNTVLNQDFSDFIIYVDESGDHSLASINKDYPVFVLTFCIFRKVDYLETVKRLQEFKFAHFGHDMAVLHETDIRRDRGAFSFLKSRELKADFLNELTQIIGEQSFCVISAVIDKHQLNTTYRHGDNPYHLAMTFCLERSYRYLQENGQRERISHVVFECRGKSEDQALELEFRRICDGQNYFNKPLPFEVIMAHKQCNSTGLQFADLLARPIGLSILRPKQENRAFDVIKNKFRHKNGNYSGYGLKIFP